MKSLKFLLLIIFFPLFGFAQSLNGIYTGVLSNDSTTIRKDQSFEMALTEYKGKVYGYAYSTFIINDTLYYIVKRVKGKVEGDVCEVEDDDVISHNFPQKPEKKVFVTYTLRRNISDSTWKLDGNWKTNVTKKYYAISGKVEAQEEKDLSKSKLYEHLGDLDLQKTLAFNKKETMPNKKAVKPKDEKDAIAKNSVKKEEQKDISESNTKSVAKTDTKLPNNKTVSTPANNQPLQNEKKDAVTTNTNTADKKTEVSVVKSDTKLPDNKTIPINNPPIQNEKKDLPASNTNDVDKKSENNIAKTEIKLSDNKTVSAPTNNTPVQNVKKDVAAASPNTVDKKIENNTIKTDTKLPDNKTVSIPANNQPNQPAKSNTVVTTIIDNKSEPVVTKQENKLVSVPVGYKPAQNSTTTTTIDKKPETNIAKTDNKLPDNKTSSVNTPSEKKQGADFEFKELTKTNRRLKPAAALVDGRETTPSETIFFKSDSLSIALYDNGEVDGDTVSVIINDELFIEKQGLKSSAFRKTFYIPKGETDSLLVVLFADNLGKYPPNTGLLQIKDGEEIFYVRFKADLNRNAAIILRRKYK